MRHNWSDELRFSRTHRIFYTQSHLSVWKRFHLLKRCWQNRRAPRRPQRGCGITMKQKKSKRRSELPEYQMSISALRSRPLPPAAPLALSLSLRVSRSPNSTSSLILFPSFLPAHTRRTLEELKVLLLTFLKAQTHTAARAWNKAKAALNLIFVVHLGGFAFNPSLFSEGRRRCLWMSNTYFNILKNKHGAGCKWHRRVPVFLPVGACLKAGRKRLSFSVPRPDLGSTSWDLFSKKSPVWPQ